MLPATLLATAAIGCVIWACDGIDRIEQYLVDWIGESAKPSIPRER